MLCFKSIFVISNLSSTFVHFSIVIVFRLSITTFAMLSTLFMIFKALATFCSFIYTHTHRHTHSKSFFVVVVTGFVVLSN